MFSALAITRMPLKQHDAAYVAAAKCSFIDQERPTSIFVDTASAHKTLAVCNCVARRSPARVFGRRPAARNRVLAVSADIGCRCPHGRHLQCGDATSCSAKPKRVACAPITVARAWLGLGRHGRHPLWLLPGRDIRRFVVEVAPALRLREDRHPPGRQLRRLAPATTTTTSATATTTTTAATAATTTATTS